ncbi:MAG: SMP-30/gluconolactonase/LRE family protein [Acidobacteriota bacterium]
MFELRLPSALVLVIALAASSLFAAPPLLADNVRILTRGAPIQGSNGIAVGPDGKLYVTSVSGREIVVMNRFSGRIIDRLGVDDGVETPDDCVFGPDGSLYWTAIFAGEVGRRAPDGTVSIVAQLPPGPNPIAFNDDGRLFVGLAAFGDGLYEVDPLGIDPPELLIASSNGGLNGFEFGPDGYLYSPQPDLGTVARIDVDARTITTFATGFTLPVALDFDSQGRLYVNDTAADEIVRIDIATGQREVFAELSDGVDNLAFDAADNLYVTSLLQGSVRKIRPNGRVRTISRGGMTTPGGVATQPLGFFGRRDKVWVADFFSLRAFSGFSGIQLDFEGTIPGISALTAPATVAADGDQLIISSWILGAVQVFDPATGQVPLNLTDFDAPLNAIRFQGDLVVAELGTGSVVRAATADPSQRTTLASDLAVPSGLAATADDLWVADTALGTIQQIVGAGQVLTPPTLVASNLAGPEGLAVLPGGDLIVVEAAAGRVSRVDPATGNVTTVADGLGLGAPPPPLVPPTWLFNGVAAGARGAVYVTGDIDNVVYKLRVH